MLAVLGAGGIIISMGGLVFYLDYLRNPAGWRKRR
jgi:hypothetical protein